MIHDHSPIFMVFRNSRWSLSKSHILTLVGFISKPVRKRKKTKLYKIFSRSLFEFSIGM